ncbi:hypothetical protein ACPOL_3438 [Acidisarcina polymorpha]|uniref:Uncharacterized protein n=1 Tax=Acidisarcina polymorpha TaxID=2211140 RepID=A0A2Z5G246_9BACT|nr:hypothetical protein ACPOL_3438 [Acidisarcina polymorpha]
MSKGLGSKIAGWFRTLNDVRNTLANWRQEYKMWKANASHIYTATTAATEYFPGW